MNQDVSAVVTDLAPRRRAKRLRAHRIRVDDLKLGPLSVSGRHPELGQVAASVADVSLTGLGLTLSHGGSAPLVMVGDRIERLVVECAQGAMYEGVGYVRRVEPRESELRLGVELASGGIDLGRLYRLGTRHDFSERMSAVLGGAVDGVDVGFKAWVADLRGYLENARRFLDSEERALGESDRFTRDQTLSAYLDAALPTLLDRMTAASRELADHVRSLPDDAHPAYRAYYRDQLMPLLSASPLLRRALDKPLGYAGDYEMMNMLYRDHAEGDSLFAKAMNVYAAREPAAQANINRLDYLGNRIRSLIYEFDGRPVRIASIGCGPSAELKLLLEQSPELGKRLDVALIDQEDRAITYCERTLGPLAAATGARVHFIKESIRRLLTEKQLSATLGQRDFIYSAGLFDYLEQRSFAALLSSLYEALIPGGQLAIGNVAKDNPTRWFMEYCLDWYLIHRSPQDLEEFAKALSPPPMRSVVDAEPLGVNLFLRIWK
jgi:extracellular factor (EF) 3-hydroxypalmitic acid methyl ester biosynthesis protein